MPPRPGSTDLSRLLFCVMIQVVNTTKICSKCKTEKPNTNEHFVSMGPKKKFRLSSHCKTCHNQASKNRHAALKLKALQHYSGSMIPSCACCHATELEFLTFDHINGGGSQHRKTVKDMAWWLNKEGFPPGFRVLCLNCNGALGFYGYCPHQRSYTTTASSVEICR